VTFDELLKQLAASEGTASNELTASVDAGEVTPVLPGPGSEIARSLHATFAIRARTSAAAGIRTVGLQTVLSQLETLNPEERVLLFHFSGDRRVFSVFVRECDLSIIGILAVDR
jgi:hypothetical protein